MAKRIEVVKKKNERDSFGEGTKKNIEEFLNLKVDSIRTGQVYTINAKISDSEMKLLLKDLFVDPITETLCSYKEMDFDWVIEIGFKPGVKDSWGDTCKKHGIRDIIKRELGKDESVHVSRQFYIKGKLAKSQIENIAKNLLANTVIETIYVFSRDEVMKKGVEIPLPIVGGEQKAIVESFSFEKFSNKQLEKLSDERLLALTLEEMLSIKKFFTDEKNIKQRKAVGLDNKITDVELECLAQTWSDHCKHKRFNALIHYKDENGKEEVIDSLFKTYIQKPSVEIGKKFSWLLSSFHDNAGVVAFNERISVADKIETHNAPSALEPYGGAITGIVGVNRDIMGTGLGAKPMINVFAYCFGNSNYKEKLPAGVLHPKRIRSGVHKGVIDGGNQTGIPLGRGREIFEERYTFRPLVYCGTIGTMPGEIKKKKTHEKKANANDLIVMAGGRIGKDGIHGATFSSGALHKESPVQAVQIGDPITQKMMCDFLLEARDKMLYTCITDNGAGGLSSSVGEMATYTNGCELDLEKAPLKYQGLAPWEILLSEAQERMTLAVSPDKIDEFLDLAKARDVEATVIGKFTSSGKFHVRHNGKTIAYLDIELLHKGLQRMNVKAIWKNPNLEEPEFEEPNAEKTLEEILQRENIRSQEDKIRQYDHEVKGLTIVKPFVGKEKDVESDACVFCMEYGSDEGLILAEGVNPYYSEIDTYWMAQSAADEAVRRIISVGGKLSSEKNFMYGLDNFCWNIHEDSGKEAEYNYAQLVRANKGLCDYYREMEFPLISGKDSMRNVYKTEDGKTIKILPTLLVSVRGKTNDVKRSVTMDVKKPGDLVYVLGETFNELGCSEYYRHIKLIGKNVPKVDAKKAKKLYRALSEATENELVNSAHTPTLGGLAVSLAKISFAGGYGLEIDLGKVPCREIDRDDKLLYSESNSRFIVTVSKENKSEFEKVVKGNVFSEIGFVTDDETLKIKGMTGRYIIKKDINELKRLWKNQ